MRRDHLDDARLVLLETPSNPQLDVCDIAAVAAATRAAGALLVEEAGGDSTQGILFRTTELFLERLGLASVDDLPPLAPLLPDVDAIDAIDAGLETGRGQ